MRIAVLAIFPATLLLAQSPQFDVASVRPFNPDSRQAAAGLHFDGAQVRGVGLSLRDYLATAYRFKATLISGPDWTATERYDISATLPDGATKSQVPEMLQALLADRFAVKLHKEQKEFPVFALVLGKGPPKLKALPSDPNEDKKDDEPIGMANVATIAVVGNGVSVRYARGATFSVGDNRIEVTRLPLWVFCRNLERYSDRQIVDLTGLTGAYTFSLLLTPEVYQSMLLRSAVIRGAKLPPEAQAILDSSPPAAIGDALDQIGLKLEQRRAPLDTIVIDSALKTPTAN